MLRGSSQLLLVCLLAVSLVGFVAAVSVAEVAERRSGSEAGSTRDRLRAAETTAVVAAAPGAVVRPPTILDGLANVIGGIRSALKKEFTAVKTWFKDTWLKAQQMYQYSRYCLNHKAPAKLGLKVPNSALCSTVRKTNKDFADYLERIVTRVPEPSLQETLKAEMAGEVARSLLEIGASNPGDKTRKWPKGPISYSLSPDLDPRATVSFQWGLNHIETVTCVRFQQVKWGTTGAVIRVIPDSSRCSSDLGYKGSTGQSVWWGPQCAAGSAAHELLHALGFDHTMNRLDRDKYVTVNMAKIMAGKTHNFVKQKSPYSDFGPYDFKSILHYPANAFAKTPANPGLAEIKKRPSTTPRALNSPWDGTAQRDALTPGDIAAVKAVYCP